MKPEIVVLYESDLARCSAEFYRKRVYLHLRVRKWGMDAMRELRKLWPEMKAVLKNLGHEAIYAYNYERDADTKWFRFMALLGFKERHRGRGLIIMEAQNA